MCKGHNNKQKVYKEIKYLQQIRNWQQNLEGSFSKTKNFHNKLKKVHTTYAIIEMVL